jgi:cell division GTPase FtsZ
VDKRAPDNEEFAAPFGAGPEAVEQVQFIRGLQKAEGHEPCFGKSAQQCSQTDCCFRTHCLAADTAPPDTNYCLPTLDLEEYQPDACQETGLEDLVKGSARYAWIGAGGCGGRLLKAFYDLGYRKVLAVNTAYHELDSLDIPRHRKFLMGITKEATARDMKRGADALRQYKQDILHQARKTFGARIDHIMVCFGAGGGTGGGSIVGLVDIAKRYARYIGLKDPDRKVGVVMTLPAVSEVGSPVTAANAHAVARQLAQLANAGKISPLIILDNDKIDMMSPAMKAKSLWTTTNSIFANLFSAFNRLSALSSPYTSFDPLDYLSIMQSAGCLTMGRTRVDRLDGRFAVSEAVKKSLKRTLFAGGLDLATARFGGCIVVGRKELMANVKGLQADIDYAFDVLSEITGQATIHRGIYEDNRDSLRVYTIIGGLDVPTDRLNELAGDSYRLPNLTDIKSPPLAQRREDILPLAEHILEKHAAVHAKQARTLSRGAKKLLLNYAWPGNVAELDKAMKRAHQLTIGPRIQPDTLPFEIIFADSQSYPKEVLPLLAETRRSIIARALDLFHGRLDDAAELLGLEPRRLSRLIQSLRISVKNQMPDS